MKDNPLLKLESYGQSIWLDFIHRGMLTTGELARLIEEDGLSGVTSNPAIFEKAIGETGEYDAAIRTLARAGKSAAEIYEELAVEDIRMTADLSAPSTNARTEWTGSSAWRSHLDLPMIPLAQSWKPGTREGLPAIRQLLSEGINVNVTLLFGLPRSSRTEPKAHRKMPRNHTGSP